MHVQEHPRWTQVQRIHIIGGPGTGKTTLSYQLADILDVPLFELDEIAGAGPAPAFRMQRPLARRLADVERIVSQPGWITEGSFLWWTDELLRSAESIIWLDFSPRLAMRRVLVRHVREYGERIATSSSVWGKVRAMRRVFARHIIYFALYTWAYYHRHERATEPTPLEMDDGWAFNRADTKRQLQPYMWKVIRCDSSTKATNLLASFNGSVPRTHNGGCGNDADKCD